MQVKYKHITLHSDRTEGHRIVLSGFRGTFNPELSGVPQFRNLKRRTLPPPVTVDSEQQTTALARIDIQLSEEQNNLRFRHLLFVVYCLATFREKSEIPSLFTNAFPGRAITPHTVTACEKWMRRLDADPDLALKGKDKRWKELWLQYCDQRKEYLGTIKDIPLAHPRKRIEALVDLFHEIEPLPVRTLQIKESVVNKDGHPIRDSKGRPVVRTTTKVVEQKDIPTALQCLKQIGVESGTYIEKTETKVTLRDLIQRRRQERGFKDTISEAHVIEESFDDAEMPEVAMPLPCPIQSVEMEDS